MALSEKHSMACRMQITEKMVHRTFNAARHTNDTVYVCWVTYYGVKQVRMCSHTEDAHKHLLN